jgi:alkyl sulfatase BDS1-like metallo-beta-lactamase superfamily hydrolase
LLASGSSEGIGVTGNPGVLQTIMGLTDEPDSSFPVVTP